MDNLWIIYGYGWYTLWWCQQLATIENGHWEWNFTLAWCLHRMTRLYHAIQWWMKGAKKGANLGYPYSRQIFPVQRGSRPWSYLEFPNQLIPCHTCYSICIHIVPTDILVGGDWNMTFMNFHSIGNVIIPIDELIFLRGVETTNQILWYGYSILLGTCFW